MGHWFTVPVEAFAAASWKMWFEGAEMDRTYTLGRHLICWEKLIITWSHLFTANQLCTASKAFGSLPFIYCTSILTSNITTLVRSILYLWDHVLTLDLEINRPKRNNSLHFKYWIFVSRSLRPINSSFSVDTTHHFQFHFNLILSVSADRCLYCKWHRYKQILSSLVWSKNNPSDWVSKATEAELSGRCTLQTRSEVK